MEKRIPIPDIIFNSSGHLCLRVTRTEFPDIDETEISRGLKIRLLGCQCILVYKPRRRALNYHVAEFGFCDEARFFSDITEVQQGSKPEHQKVLQP